MKERKAAANEECDQCLSVAPLVVPVVYVTLGGKIVERLCLRCRLDYPRDEYWTRYAGRIEGRHGRFHAVPVPCSMQRLLGWQPL